jgi:uracil-DNA glycosylase
MDIEELQAAIRACRRCYVAGYAITPAPIFRGHPQAQIMVIGQAPGVTEVSAGRPFNAGSGRRLFTWLRRAGFDEDDFRDRQYMAAVTRCYPGRNASGRGDRVASKAEQALCRPFLEQEIALLNPRLIILVGGLALRLFYPPAARLEEVIGTAAYFAPQSLKNPVNFDLSQATIHPAFDSTLPADGRWVVPLPHPSGASLWPNDPANQALIERAIGILRAWREANDPGVP